MDVTHLKGRRSNKLIGFGLVVGLQGTGDGGKYAASIAQLQRLLENFEIPIPAAALTDTRNVAIVQVEVVLPDNGVREGDTVDVAVSSTGSAKSLVGGRLVMTPLQGVDLGGIYAWASGPVSVPDPRIRTSGVIKRGATMEADVIHNYISDESRITLVLEDDYASWSWAAAIAERINEDASEIGRIRELAIALDPKNIEVTIPEVERRNPASFIADIENIELMLPPSEARVVINRRTGTIMISENVTIGPAVIAHNGMSIMTVQPPPQPTPDNPIVKEQFVAGVIAPPATRGGARLQELVDALNALNVPSKDVIEIIENLYRGGKITGKLEFVE
jgi:flagellar P-ring protein precursor FlgI